MWDLHPPGGLSISLKRGVIFWLGQGGYPPHLGAGEGRGRGGSPPGVRGCPVGGEGGRGAGRGGPPCLHPILRDFRAAWLSTFASIPGLNSWYLLTWYCRRYPLNYLTCFTMISPFPPYLHRRWQRFSHLTNNFGAFALHV